MTNLSQLNFSISKLNRKSQDDFYFSVLKDYNNETDIDNVKLKLQEI